MFSAISFAFEIRSAVSLLLNITIFLLLGEVPLKIPKADSRSLITICVSKISPIEDPVIFVNISGR